MAGEWIKFELATHDKPEIWAMAESLGIDPDAVVGKCLRVWGWFDQQSRDGNAPTVTKSLLDRNVGVAGFCDVMASVGWLVIEGDTMRIPNFDHHNGKTSKERALAAKRAAKHRQKSNGDSNAHTVTPSVTSALPREEKRRDSNKGQKFIPPTVEEVRDYCQSRGNGINPQKFVDHYEANGWMRGKNKLKDWKAAVRTWEGNQAEAPKHDFARGAI